MIQIEEELESIERLARRVEQANYSPGADTGTILLTSVLPGQRPGSNVGGGAEGVRAPQAVGMVEVIQQFGDIAAQIDRASSKSICVQVEFPCDDFPRETSERLEVVARADRYTHALAVKDQILWTAMQEKKVLEERLDEERGLSQEYAKEVAQWAELAQQLGGELETMRGEKEAMERRNKELVEVLRKHNLYYVISKPEIY